MDEEKRGSLWRKWDLHVHTPASFHWNGGKTLSEMNSAEIEKAVEAFINTVNESDVAVFAIQDYWTFDWIIELRKYLRAHPGTLKKKVLPGMELRVECSVDYRLNIHAIISDQVTDQELIDFRSELKIHWQGDETKNVSDETLKNFAKRLDPSKASFHGFKDPSTLSDKDLLKLGSMTVEVTRESLSSALKKIPKGMGVIMLPYSTSDGLLKLDWEQHPHDDLYFMNTADIFESRDQRNVDLFAGIRTDENTKFFDNFYKTLGEKPKPCVSGSDAHQFSHYGNFPSNRATWIKADPTYEGFRQIVYEPKDRVKIQQLEPEEKSSQLVIDYLEYKNPGGDTQKVLINQNLNAVIGSRAQGKSNLLKNIAYAIDPEQMSIRNIDTSDFLRLDNFKVVWKDGSINTLDPNEAKVKGVLFIPQKFLGELLYGKEPKFDKFLTNLFENKEDFKKGLEIYRKSSDQNMVEITSSLREVLEALGNGMSETQALRKLGSRASFAKELSDLDARLKQLGAEALIKEEELKQYDELNSSYVKLEKDIRIQVQDVASLEKMQAGQILTSDSIENFDLSLITYSKIRKEISATDEDFKKEVIAKEILSIGESIEKNKVILEQLSEKIKPLRDKIIKNESLTMLTKRQSALRETIEQIEIRTKTLEGLRTQFHDRKIELISKYAAFRSNYDLLNFTLPELKFARVNLVITYDTDSLRRWAEENINYHNSVEFKKNEDSRFTNAIAYLDNPMQWAHDSNGLEILLKELTDGILSGKLAIKAGRDVETVIQGLMRNRYKIDFLKSVTNNDGIPFKSMSDGEQMLSLLEMIFKFDDYDYPVLLDQPEDDLDSRAISTTVVNFLTNEKQARQLMIASHNANLVVCGDSENIIISNKTGGYTPSFEYVTGAIENPVINKEILEVLEGGEEAFDKRRRKIGK